MDLVNLKISKKISKPNSSIYLESKPTDDYQFDPSNLWISASEFENLELEYPHFSPTLLISGLLFCKSKKTHKDKWFRAKFYGLFKDYLVLYSVFFLFLVDKC